MNKVIQGSSELSLSKLLDMSSVDKVEHCSSAASDAVTETSIHHCSIFPIYCCTEVFLVKKFTPAFNVSKT